VRSTATTTVAASVVRVRTDRPRRASRLGT
jgi:hypothetical protein